MKTFLIFSILFFLIIQVQAQDVIVRMSGDSIYCKIKEIATKKVTYQRPDFAGQTLFSIPKSDIDLIIFENKNIMVFDHGTVKRTRARVEETIELGPIDYPKTNKKMIIEFNPAALLLGCAEFGIERSIKRGVSWELGAGYIFGHPDDFILGDLDFSSTGFYLRSGIKFIKSSDEYLHRTPHPHILQGFFVKPELIYSTLYYNGGYYGYTHNVGKQYYCTSLIVNVGTQFVKYNIFSFEWNVGLGIGISNADNEMYFFGSNIAGTVPPYYLPLSFTAGFKIGILTY